MKDSATSMPRPRKTPARALFLPPAGRPRWVCPESRQLGLQYLGWGKRLFGKSPVPISLHHGWVYFLLRRGSPTLQMLSQSFRVQPRQVLVVGPDCASGWTADAVENITDMLIWVWQSPPRCPGLSPPANDFRVFNPDQALLHTLEQIHTLCRTEVEQPDAFTPVALEALHLRLDVALARSLKPPHAAPEPALRLELARRWLDQNLAESKPVAKLCEYLQVSAATVNRLFQSHLHESVAAYHTRLRMERADQLLKSGRVAVKEAAYTLGYRHANDFSRAFKKFTGRKPSAK